MQHQMVFLSPAVVTLVLVLASPAAGRPVSDDSVVLEALPAPLLGAPAALPRNAALETSQQPRLRSSQGPEGFAYESSHPVLDAYGVLSTA